MIADRMKPIDASGIRKVFELAAKMKNPVNLSIGQPDFDVPEPLKQAAIRAIEQGENRYTLTQGTAALRAAVLRLLRERYAVPATEQGVMITSGVSGGLLLAYMALLDPGDEVIVFDPYFVMYTHLVNLINAVPVIVDTYPDFLPDPSRVAAAVTPRTRAIMINSPTNPTGAVYPETLLRELAAIADKHGLVIISDEIYADFMADGVPHVSPGSFYPRTLTLGGFGKTFGMTGWRLGYAAGPEALLAEMIKVQQYTFVCAPAPLQAAALAAIDYDMSAALADYRAKRQRSREALQDEFAIAGAQGAFYLFPEVPVGCGSAAEFCSAAIERKEVLIIPGNVFSEHDTHFRISFAADDDMLQTGLDRIVELKRELAGG